MALQYSTTFDADLGEGFVALKDTILVHLESPMAGSLGMTVTPPRQQPTPPSA